MIDFVGHTCSNLLLCVCVCVCVHGVIPFVIVCACVWLIIFLSVLRLERVR